MLIGVHSQRISVLDLHPLISFSTFYWNLSLVHILLTDLTVKTRTHACLPFKAAVHRICSSSCVISTTEHTTVIITSHFSTGSCRVVVNCSTTTTTTGCGCISSHMHVWCVCSSSAMIYFSEASWLSLSASTQSSVPSRTQNGNCCRNLKSHQPLWWS